MAGHSKWANIKHKKAALDAKRGKVFSAISKKISSAARRGGGDPDMNTELRLYIQKARAANMPAENITRVVLKATGQLPGVAMESFTYEGYAAGGVAIFLEGATDNKNRTVSNIRYAFSRNGGNLGANGCVSWMFHEKGLFTLDDETIKDADALMEVAMDNGAEDIEEEDGTTTLTSGPTDFMKLRDALVEAGYTEFLTDELTRIAENHITPTVEEAKQVMRLVEILEDDDDIESVYHNMELTDELAAALEAE